MTTGLKAKHQRLILIVIALVALVGAGLLAAYALRSQASYFYVPAQMVADPPTPGDAVRLGGMVQAGSLKTEADGVTFSFVVGDGEATVPVRFAGILPDLFIEGSGVVAEGRLDPGGTFVADNLLAKHDENYVPRELEEMTEQQAREVVAETSAGPQDPGA
ncbi:cytochrome c maturation protein CcmE [Allopontixanthobacter sediminis]|uniref:Cytochrome c-type biogenesis protein CcmE n=1 Tax=Allopontixanthobacter sediminis TaxID=1689985 RepID=A0A845B2U6_9SPHN|nr:cytochrome c maturation protein CcmE [Allopontixanthobacter sediminis]MXP43932.1 cytochrome c maturation protein CcmE [Allopontixanthobacter sediminis]